MVNLITGPKGTGKTQQMIELANEKVKTSNGNVVFIKKSHRNTTTLDFGVHAAEEHLLPSCSSELRSLSKISAENTLDFFISVGAEKESIPDIDSDNYNVLN